MTDKLDHFHLTQQKLHDAKDDVFVLELRLESARSRLNQLQREYAEALDERQVS